MNTRQRLELTGPSYETCMESETEVMVRIQLAAWEILNLQTAFPPHLSLKAYETGISEGRAMPP